jgi:hypothetical protein
MGAEQPGECPVIGELTLEFGEWVASVSTRDLPETFLESCPERRRRLVPGLE